MRTDVHRPTELVTENYEYVGDYWTGGYGCPGIWHLSDEAKADDSVWQGVYGTDLNRCDHCGAHIAYGAEMLYKPTGGRIHVGEICLGNRFERATIEFQALRKQAKLDQQAHKILTAWNAYQDEHQDAAGIVLHNLAPVQWADLHASENAFVKDVLRKGRQYGNLSDKQLEAIVKAVDRDAKKADEPEEVKVDAPAGKQTFTGTVVSRKGVEGYYGFTTKITIKVETPDGIWLCWVTEPAKLFTEVGDTVTMTANLTVSDRDPAFAFGKRPTKASVVKAPEEVTA